nr:MAG TPA: hypothetical protein [Caudoviricetes sp.]
MGVGISTRSHFLMYSESCPLYLGFSKIFLIFFGQESYECLFCFKLCSTRRTSPPADNFPFRRFPRVIYGAIFSANWAHPGRSFYVQHPAHVTPSLIRRSHRSSAAAQFSPVGCDTLPSLFLMVNLSMLALLALQFLIWVVTGPLLIFRAVTPVSHICFPFLSPGIRASVCREIIFSLVSLSTTIPTSRYPHMDASRSRFFAVCAVTRIEIRRIFFLLMPQPSPVIRSHTGSGSSHCCRTVPARSLATADRSIGKSLRPDGAADCPRVCLHISCGSPGTPLTPAVPQLCSVPLLCSNSSPPYHPSNSSNFLVDRKMILLFTHLCNRLISFGAEGLL